MGLLQFSNAVRSAMADVVESTIGPNPVLKIFSGAAPANVAAANSGVQLASMTLPTDWWSAAVNGVKTLLGTWQDSAADASGTAAHFRIYASDGVTCHGQGTITATGGGGDIELSTTTIVAGQVITITAETLTMGNA